MDGGDDDGDDDGGSISQSHRRRCTRLSRGSHRRRTRGGQRRSRPADPEMGLGLADLLHLVPGDPSAVRGLVVVAVAGLDGLGHLLLDHLRRLLLPHRRPLVLFPHCKQGENLLLDLLLKEMTDVGVGGWMRRIGIEIGIGERKQREDTGKTQEF